MAPSRVMGTGEPQGRSEVAAAAFFAIYKKIGLPYILLADGAISILFYGFLF